MTRPSPAAPAGAVLKMMALRVGTTPDSDTLATAAQKAYEDLVRVFSPLIGEVGIDALAARAVHLAQREYSWLLQPGERNLPADPFARVVACLRRQDSTVAAEAAGAVFAQLTGLLVTFIGEPLTMGLLRNAWPDVFLDAITEESKA